MGMPAVRRRWTATQVRALRATTPLATPRYELVDGELLVTSSPTGPHQIAVRVLLGELIPYLTANPVGEVLTSPFDVELEPDGGQGIPGFGRALGSAKRRMRR